MPFPVENKLVVAVASSALFDLTESDSVYREKGTEAYRQFQREHQADTLRPGVAFPFIKRLLNLNDGHDDAPVEVILLSRNDPDTGLRVFKSIEHYKLQITRAAFCRGRSPYRYIPAFNASLFLSANENDVREALMKGFPAGRVVHAEHEDDPDDKELRIAFDFDGVLVDDEAEVVYQKEGLAEYHLSEKEKAGTPLNPGPLQRLLREISNLQKVELEKHRNDPDHEPRVRTAIITARNAPAHERLITTLREWGISVDETFFLGGMEKRRILEEFRPHIFFDDQMLHLDTACGIVPSVHVPFGVTNV